MKETYIVLLLGSDGVDEVVLGHERLPVLVLLRIAEEIGASLVRQRRFLCAADQFLLDGFLDATHGDSRRVMHN